MNYIKIFFICLILLGYGCNQDTEKVLKDTSTEKVVYQFSFKYAINQVVANHVHANEKMRYVFRLDKEGYINTVFRNRLITLVDVSGMTQYLVSDTSNNDVTGPNLFKYPIIGYYGKMIEYDSVKHIVKKITPAEIAYFHSIDSLMKKNNLDFKPLDSIENLYWFWYEF